MYYIYLLVRPNGKPFYVGKGKGDRIFDHEKEARRGHRCHKCNAIRKIWSQGGEVQRYTIFTTDDEQLAFEYEKEMIALLGRSTLTNATDGGEGMSNLTPEAREKHRAASRAMWRDPLFRQRMRDIQGDPEARRHNSDRNKAMWNDPDYRARMTEIVRSVTASAETRAKISATHRARWENNAEHREKILALRRSSKHREGTATRSRERWSDPEYKAARREGIKELWRDPEYRAKVQQGMSNRATPEYRAKMSAAVKAARARKKATQIDPEDESPLPADAPE